MPSDLIPQSQEKFRIHIRYIPDSIHPRLDFFSSILKIVSLFSDYLFVRVRFYLVSCVFYIHMLIFMYGNEPRRTYAQ